MSLRKRSLLATLSAVLLSAMLALAVLGSSTGQFKGSGQLTRDDVGGAPFTGMVLQQSVSGLFKPLSFPYSPSNGCGIGPASVEIDFTSGAVIIASDAAAKDCTTPALFTAMGDFTITSATGIYNGASGTFSFNASARGPEHSTGVLYFSWNGRITLP